MACDSYLLHLNMRAFSDTKMAELYHTLDHVKPIVVSLNETWLRPEVEVSVQGYRVFRKDRLTARGGGVVVLVREDIPALERDVGHLSDGNEAVAVDLVIKPRNLTVISLYSRPGCRVDTGLLDRLATGDAVVLGDLNAKDPMLLSRGSNVSGAHFVQWLQQSDLMLLSNGEATHTSDATGTSDQLDLVLCTSRLFARMSEPMVGEDLGSDHLPVLVAIGSGASLEENGSEWYDTRRVDWNRFKDRADVHLGVDPIQPPRSCEEIDALNERISTALLQAANDTVPKRRPSKIQSWRFTPEIERAVKSRRRCRKLYQQTGWAPFKAQAQYWQRQRDALIADQKRAAAERLCTRMAARHKTSSREFWADFRKLQSGNKQPCQPIPPIRHNDVWYSTNQEKADLFATQLEAGLTADGPNMDEDFKARVDCFVQEHPWLFQPLLEYPPVADTDPLCRVTQQDVERIVRSLPEKAPGPDGMLNAFLRNAPERAHEALAMLYQASLDLGYLPASWKEAKTVMIDKPGKERDSVKGWRPLGLTGAIGKLLEKLLAARVLPWLDKRNLLPLHQTSYRASHCTADQLVRFVECATRGFARRHSTVAAFLDIEGAFNHVWHNGMRFKVAETGLPVALVRWLSNFLTGRRLKVQVGGTDSRWIVMLAGVPQGSPASPVMFSIYTADLPSSQSECCDKSVYADDLGTWATHPSVRYANDQLNRYLEKVSIWCKQWRMTLNPAKCKAVLFTHKRDPPGIRVLLNGVELPVADEARFLGLVLDKRLNMQAHVRDVQERTGRRLTGLRALACLGGRGFPLEAVIDVYCTFVRSVISYSCAAWLHVSDAQLNKLQLIQNSALRMAMHAPQWTRIDQLHQACNVPRLKEYLHASAQQYWTKACVCTPLMGKTLGEHRVKSRFLVNARTPISVLGERIPVGPHHRLDIVRERTRPDDWEQSIARVLTEGLIRQ
jgi:hypothetical protein